MKEKICIAKFSNEETGLFQMVNDLEVTMLRIWLEQNGIDTMVYTDKELPSMVDLAEDMDSISFGYYILLANEKNCEYVESLKKHLLETNEDSQLLVLPSKYRDGMSFYEKAALSAFLLEIDESLNIEHRLGRIYGNSKLTKNINANVVPLTNYFDDGAAREYEDIVADMKVCAAEIQAGECLYLDGVQINRVPFFEQLMRYANENHICVEVALDATVQPYDGMDSSMIRLCVLNEDGMADAEALRALWQDRITMFYLDVSLLAHTDGMKLMDYAKKHNKPVQFVNYKQYWLESYDPKLLDVELARDKSFVALYNGFLASRCGEYGNVQLNGYTKHVEIDYAHLNVDVLEKLSEVCSVNSSLFVKNKEFDLAQGTPIHKDTNYQTYFYDELKEDIVETRKLRNSNPINLITKDSLGGLSINNVRCDNEMRFYFKTYAEMKSLREVDEGGFYFIRIADSESFKFFMEDAVKFVETNSLKDSPLAIGKIENGCRFITRNFCSVEKLPRFTVEANGDIYPCFEKCKKLGSLENSYFELLQKAYVDHESELRKRDCINCIANSWCPKCTVLPDYIESYCDIMKYKTYVTDYILDSRMVASLTKRFAIFKDKKIEDFFISTEHSQFNVKDERIGTEIPYFNKYVCIITCDGYYLIWSPSHGRYFNISRTIAVIGECLLKRWKVADVKAYLVQIGLCTADNVDQICTAAFAKFKESGLLHRNVV